MSSTDLAPAWNNVGDSTTMQTTTPRCAIDGCTADVTVDKAVCEDCQARRFFTRG